VGLLGDLGPLIALSRVAYPVFGGLDISIEQQHVSDVCPSLLLVASRGQETGNGRFELAFTGLCEPFDVVVPLEMGGLF
jgi:hypothetical protein